MRDVVLMVLQQQWEELPVTVGFTHAGVKCWAMCWHRRRNPEDDKSDQ